MRDEASLRRLAEMGIDVYLPRAVADIAKGMRRAMDGPSAAIPNAAAARAASAPPVVLLADASAAHARTLLADVSRAIRFAGFACVHVAATDEASLGTARVLVALGRTQARAAGALLPAQRQHAIGWVVAAEPADIVGDARAKRALWSELARMLRGLAADAGAG